MLLFQRGKKNNGGGGSRGGAFRGESQLQQSCTTQITVQFLKFVGLLENCDLTAYCPSVCRVFLWGRGWVAVGEILRFR